MRKLLSLPFKYAATPFVFVAVVLLVTGSLVRNGWSKTDKNLEKLNNLFEGLNEK